MCILRFAIWIRTKNIREEVEGQCFPDVSPERPRCAPVETRERAVRSQVRKFTQDAKQRQEAGDTELSAPHSTRRTHATLQHCLASCNGLRMCPPVRDVDLTGGVLPAVV